MTFSELGNSFGLIRSVRVTYGDHPNLPSVSVYFQGCDAIPKCIGCHNPETWKFDSAYKVEFSHLLKILDRKIEHLLVSHKVISLALLGGEPLTKINREIAYLLAKFVKEKYGESVRTILYTWRSFKQLLYLDIPLDYFDEFVLGKYVKEYDTGSFPASKNQIYITRDRLLPILQSLIEWGEKVCQNY
ncbi:MAG: 4Fe-4S cluster-binding domain-containing protein [Fervidobacterium sp.]